MFKYSSYTRLLRALCKFTVFQSEMLGFSQKVNLKQLMNTVMCSVFTRTLYTKRLYTIVVQVHILFT